MLDEQSWLTCTEPAAMLMVVGHEKKRFVTFLEAAFGDIKLPEPVACDDPRFWEVPSGIEFPPNSCDLIREIWGNPWKPFVIGEIEWRGSKIKPTLISPDILTWKGDLIPRTAKAIDKGIADWSHTQLVADMLEEAGCQVPEVIDHLRGREKCPWCEGEGSTRLMPGIMGRKKCPHCTGAGFRPAKHVRGCWVLQLLIGR